jgi:hypothetical protein
LLRKNKDRGRPEGYRKDGNHVGAYKAMLEARELNAAQAVQGSMPVLGVAPNMKKAFELSSTAYSDKPNAKKKSLKQESETLKTDGEMIARYLELRVTVQKMTEDHEASTKPYREAMVIIEGTLGQKMIDQDITNIKAEGVGTAFRQKGTSIKVADRKAFMDFVFETPGGDRFLTAHIAKEAAEEFMTANDGALPPGVEATHFFNTRFRKA